MVNCSTVQKCQQHVAIDIGMQRPWRVVGGWLRGRSTWGAELTPSFCGVTTVWPLPAPLGAAGASCTVITLKSAEAGTR